MNSKTLIIVSIVVILIIVIIAAVILVESSKTSGATGTSGITGATGTCSTICDVSTLGCQGSNTMLVQFGGTGCPSSCSGTTQTISYTNCVGPVCASSFCTPQQALYTNLGANNTLYLACSAGSTGSGFFPNPCTDPTNASLSTSGAYLATLVVKPSNLDNNEIYPIFITTIGLSIYGTTQPTAPSGISQESIAINMTDPTVQDDPYVLYQNSAGILSMQRLSLIISIGQVSQAIWIYDVTNPAANLYLFSTLGNSEQLDVSSLDYICENAIGFTWVYYGSLSPCGYIAPNSNPSNVSAEFGYDPNGGFFFATQYNDASGGNDAERVDCLPNQSNPYPSQGIYLSNSPDPTPDAPTNGYGYVLTSAPSPIVPYNPQCVFLGGTTSPTAGNTRFYSINATYPYLAAAGSA